MTRIAFSRRSTVHDRRAFLKAATSCAFLPFIGRAAHGVLLKPTFDTNPFALGVASGDPNADGVVLWTRLAPDPIKGGGMPQENVAVRWELATDEQFQKVVQTGTAMATPELGHSVHVEVSGLQPDRWYFYRFHAGDVTSPIGRTRTAPAVDAAQDVDFAFVSCQHYESGYFNAYRHMLDDDLDVVIHLGDYIYEGGIGRDKVRYHNGPEIVSLNDYRNRLALYRSDEDLLAAHAKCPWLVTWDDHEFDNNYAGDVSEEEGVDPVAFLERRAQAYQAFYEHMPLRTTSMPEGPMMQLYRRIPFGRLVDFDVLDTRQYRSDQPCGDTSGPPCDGIFAADATMLGQEQEEWLRTTLTDSPATWNVLAQQVMMARVDRNPFDGTVWNVDQWGGYDVARKRLIQFVAEAKIANPVVLTGDIHANWCNDLKVDFDDENSAIIATEFVGTSITSGGDGSEERWDTKGVLHDNPFVKFYNAERGYVRCKVTEETWQSDYRVVDKVTQKESTCITRASFVVESGQAGAERL